MHAELTGQLADRRIGFQCFQCDLGLNIRVMLQRLNISDLISVEG